MRWEVVDDVKCWLIMGTNLFIFFLFFSFWGEKGVGEGLSFLKGMCFLFFPFPLLCLMLQLPLLVISVT